MNGRDDSNRECFSLDAAAPPCQNIYCLFIAEVLLWESFFSSNQTHPKVGATADERCCGHHTKRSKTIYM